MHIPRTGQISPTRENCVRCATVDRGSRSGNTEHMRRRRRTITATNATEEQIARLSRFAAARDLELGDLRGPEARTHQQTTLTESQKRAFEEVAVRYGTTPAVLARGLILGLLRQHGEIS